MPGTDISSGNTMVKQKRKSSISGGVYSLRGDRYSERPTGINAQWHQW